MSTPTPARDADRAVTTAIPTPRRSADPPVDAFVARRSSNRQAAPSEQLGVYGRHPWLIPATGIVCVIAIFVAMIMLNWAAGGGTPFDR
jgi:hypothetical protein